MKSFLRVLSFLLLAALPMTLLAQNPTLVLYYMKTLPGEGDTYLEVEKAFKQIHQKSIDEGLIAGWQLWKKHYTGADDPYNYITIHWYNSWKHTFTDFTAGFYDEFLDGPDGEILRKTGSVRTIVKREVLHQVATAENSKGASFILVNHMKVKPGMAGEYADMEREVYKPLQEEAIRRGQMSHWGLWVTYPYDDAHLMYSTVDGFESIEQLTGDRENLMPVVHPDLDPDEIEKKVNGLRTVASVELWELVDYLFPESE